MGVPIPESSIDQKGSKLPQYGAAVIVNIIAFAYGTVMGWSANAIPILQSSESPVDGGPLSGDNASWIGSLLCLGAFVSTPFYSYLAQHMGRKLTGYLVAIPLIISWLIMIFANNLPMLFLSRIIVGISSGGIMILCPLYVGEIAEDSVRGAIGTFFPFFINAGILFAFLIGAYANFLTMAIVYLIVPLVFLVGFPFIPETPISLLNRDQDDEASKSLIWLRGKANVHEELSKMKAFVKEMKGATTKITKSDLVNRGAMVGIAIGMGLCANQQLCGIFAIMTYTVSIFQDSGSDMSPTNATILVGVLQLGASVIAALLMDRAGRKMLLIISNLWMAVCLFLIGIFFYQKEIGVHLDGYGWVPVIALSSYVVAFGIGLGPVPFVMISEIFSTKVRGIAITLSLSTIWLLAFAVAKLYANLTDLLGTHGCYWLFAVCCVLGAIFAIYVVPETKNRNLESILKELNGEKVIETDWTSNNASFPMSNI